MGRCSFLRLLRVDVPQARVGGQGTQVEHHAGLLVADDVPLGREQFEQLARPILERWFESEPLRATLATDAIIGAFAPISAPGSASGSNGTWLHTEPPSAVTRCSSTGIEGSPAGGRGRPRGGTGPVNGYGSSGVVRLRLRASGACGCVGFGSGASADDLLTLVPSLVPLLDGVVDSNPRAHGTVFATTGHTIGAPDDWANLLHDGRQLTLATRRALIHADAEHWPYEGNHGRVSGSARECARVAPGQRSLAVRRAHLVAPLPVPRAGQLRVQLRQRDGADRQ